MASMKLILLQDVEDTVLPVKRSTLLPVMAETI